MLKRFCERCGAEMANEKPFVTVGVALPERAAVMNLEVHWYVTKAGFPPVPGHEFDLCRKCVAEVISRES